jgi:hypothetical protein
MISKDHGEEKYKEYLEECLKTVLNDLNKDQDKNMKVDDIPKRKTTDIDEETEKSFDAILKFVVHQESGDVGIIVDKDLIDKYNKDIITVLLTNIDASLAMLKEHLSN